MHDAAQIFVGTHDFTTFRSVHCQSASPIKSIDRMVVRRFGEELEVEVAARSFLHNQVRSMVGCLVLVGEGKWSADDLKAALDAKNRTALGFNAPPDGLYFIEANYPA
jgi:tRNA pseudouridine38-40 synthase